MKKKIKIALSSPEIRLSDCHYNARLLADEAVAAVAEGAQVILFPELSLTGATLGDLFSHRTVLIAAEESLKLYIELTAELPIMSFVGMPVFDGERIYDASVAVYMGDILGVSVAKDPENRVFARAPYEPTEITLAGQSATLADTLVYNNDDTRVKIFCRVGGYDSLNIPETELGVDLVVCPVSMPEYLGLDKKRRDTLLKAAAGGSTAVAVCSSGIGESGTDGIYAGARVVLDSCGIKESALFECSAFVCELTLGDISVEYEAEKERVVRYPFIPEEKTERDRASQLALEIQARALAQRIKRSYSKKAVIGVSGGLDSTLAVLVAAKAMDILGMSREDVIAITMPCFGTTERTKSNALALAELLGCTVRTIDIKAAVNQHFEDIAHDKSCYSVVYENAQARERTQILMDVANAEGGLVVGTGDLSELALGFATYNGDHMSMYGVNASVPKTLMRVIIAYAADVAEKDGNARLAEVLRDVINTPISPELLPTEDAENAQSTEKIVGPYELHDFFLYYMVKYGYTPSELSELAVSAFSPDYDQGQIDEFLKIFIRRFFSQQFKRSCLPDGPRVTEISLSPRGAFSMPSDMGAKIWSDYFKQ